MYYLKRDIMPQVYWDGLVKYVLYFHFYYYYITIIIIIIIIIITLIIIIIITLSSLLLLLLLLLHYWSKGRALRIENDTEVHILCVPED